ncbi:alpha/beta hydrolase [Kitasatospora sp. NBC_00070]|uniref:alpha/beta hydrolase n=1 Tax=Kitasatospora sp. NBC_00070 TaxID=2975962 RepID=UPI003255BFD9
MPLDPPIAAVLEQVNAGGPLHFTGDNAEQMREVNRQMVAANPLPSPIEVGSVQDATVAGPAGAVPIRVYRPADTGPVPTVVFFHGGGWVTGDLDTHDDVCRRICRDVRAVVVAVHYRRVPEDRFPAAMQDCLAVARHVADHIDDYGARPERLALAGDSAGAHEAAVVALTFRDEGRPLAAQLLAYPPTDFTRDYPSITENADGYFLTKDLLSEFRTGYAGDDPQARRNWQVSPLLADHSGLAPAIIATAQYDPLRDEGHAYAEALQQAGVDVFYRNYDGVIHAFLNLFGLSPAAEQATNELLTELAKRLT